MRENGGHTVEDLRAVAWAGYGRPAMFSGAKLRKMCGICHVFFLWGMFAGLFIVSCGFLWDVLGYWDKMEYSIIKIG